MSDAYPVAQVQPTPAPAPAPVRSREREPESIGQLLGLLAKQFAKSLPLRIVSTVVVFLVVWLVHTYLLVGPNGGFAPNDGSLFGGFSLLSAVLGQVLALSGRVLGGTLFWFVLSLTVSTLITSIRQPGGGFLSRLGDVPSTIGASFASQRTAALLAGAGWGSLLTGVADNRFVAILLVVATVFAIAGGEADFTHLILRCGYNDGRKALSKPKRRLAAASADAFLVGFALVALVFGLAFLLPGWLFTLVGVGLLVGAAVVSQNRAAAAGAAGMLVFLIVFVALRVAYADDGGWAEAGGTLIDWLTSEGAALAAALGLTPAMAAALGAIIGALGPELGGLFVAGIMPTLLTPPTGPGLGVQGGNGPAQCQGGLPNYWVDAATGRLGVTDRIAGWRGVGPEVSLGLAWGGPDAGTGPFGRGWSFDHDGCVRVEDGTLVASAGSLTITFEPQPAQPGQPSVALPVGGGGSRLMGYAGAWVWEDPDARVTRRFDAGADGLFRLASVTDLNGGALTLQRDQAGRLAWMVDAAGRRITFEPDAYGRVARLTLPDGRAARFEYDGLGDLVRTTDLAGVVTEYTYDASGLLAAMVVGRDRKTTLFAWAQTPDGPMVAAVTDAAGGVTRYDIVPGVERTVRVTDPEGRATLYRTQGGRVTETVDPAGVSIRYLYDEAGRLASVTGPSGTTRAEYDSGVRVSRSIDALGRATAYHYDAAGDLVRRVAPDGGAWTFAYDGRRNLIGGVSPAGRRTSMTWDDKGRMTSQTDPDGATRDFAYDASGNLTSTTGPDGVTAGAEWDAAGLRPIRLLDPAGRATSLEYDANDRVVRTVFADGSEERAIYDCCAQVALTDESGATFGVQRDPMMRPLSFVSEGTPGSAFTYDRSGQMTSMAIGGQTVAWFELDAAGRPKRTVRCDGSATERTFDAAGRPVFLRTPRGYTVEVGFDAGGRPVRLTDPYGAIEAGFDAGDRLAWSRNARGHVIEIGYDADGLPLAKKVDGKQTVSYDYTPGGALRGVEAAGGTEHYALDTAGRVKDASYGDGTSVQFAYGDDGQVASIALPDGTAVSYQYDPRGRAVAATFGGHRVDWAYSPGGDLVEERRSNGVTTTYAWRAGVIRRLSHAKGLEPLFDVTWEYDALGRISSASGVRAAGPVAAARKPLTTDATGRVSAVGEQACTFDADGNLLARHGAYEAEHDPDNRMVLLAPSGESSTTYTYDGFGRRVRREGPDGVRVYHHDPSGRVLFETDGDGRVDVVHVWHGPILSASLVRGAVRFYHTDAVAGVVAVTDGAGAVVAAYDYDAFGAVTSSEGPEAGQPFRFAGCAGVTAEPAGLYFAQHRFYDPAMGQFIEKDPAGWAGTLEPYDYCAGDPVNAFDATGFEGVTMADVLRFTGLDKPGEVKRAAGTINIYIGLSSWFAAGTAIATGSNPVGWGILAVFALGRLWAGLRQSKEGIAGEGFGPNENPLWETIDPTVFGRKFLRGAWDVVCFVPRRIYRGAKALKDYMDTPGPPPPPRPDTRPRFEQGYFAPGE